MSTRHTDIDADQEAPPRGPGSFYTAETLPRENMFPPGNVPQPPWRPPRRKRSYWFAVAAVIVVVALIFSVFALVVSQQGQHPTNQVTPTTPGATVTTTPGEQTPTPAPGVVLGPQACPPSVADPVYWNGVLHTPGTDGQVESISCANVLGNSTVQALITVRHRGANSTLDVYVFDKVTSAHPAQLFKLSGLIKGKASISFYNSILTAEVDQRSALNAGKPVAQWAPDLFREFAWNNGAPAQVAFLGIFPDLTRFQAEADQVSVNAGHDTWKNDPVQVAKSLEARFFGWQRAVTAKLLSGGGPHDVSATVQVQEAPIQSSTPTIVVTLSRLEGNIHNMWVAIGVADGTTLTLSNIDPRQLLTSPVTLEGTGSAFESLIGQAVVYDHLYTDIGNAPVHGSKGAGEGTYTTTVSYTSSFTGIQEGLVAVYEDNAGMSPENRSVVMVKVLLNPEPGVVLGPVPGPISVSDPSHWTQFVTAPPAIREASSVSFGHLLGNTSLQAVVVATDILGGGPVYRSIFVFDKITDSHPQLLFQVNHLLHGNAQISGYSTLLTAQVDPNSSINTGKSGDQLTVDLYREFGWDGKSGSFVQVVFPGMYPDLTHWQAEAAQDKTLLQQDTWNLDAMKTAQHFVAQFVRTAPTTPPMQLQLVSGGGAHDLTAQINAAYPITGTQLGPVTRITLKRLEGNVNGVWEVTAVQADWMSISSPKSGSATHISTPVTVTGDGSQFESQVGTVYILDHLSTSVGSGYAMGSAGFGSGPFTVTVPYVSSYQGGAQEGIVELVHTGGASFDYGLVFVKVLVNP